MDINNGLLEVLYSLLCRGVVAGQSEGGLKLGLCALLVAVAFEQVAEFHAGFEGRSGVGLGVRGEIGAKDVLGDVCFCMKPGEDAGYIDEGRAVVAVDIDGVMEGFDRLIRLVAAVIEVAEIEPCVRMVCYGGSSLEFALGGAVVVLFFGGESANAMGCLGKLRLDAKGEGERFVDSAADDGWSADVVLTEIVDGVVVAGIKLDGGFEGGADFVG